MSILREVRWTEYAASPIALSLPTTGHKHGLGIVFRSTRVPRKGNGLTHKKKTVLTGCCTCPGLTLLHFGYGTEPFQDRNFQQRLNRFRATDPRSSLSNRGP
jgi:hypothetical protein